RLALVAGPHAPQPDASSVVETDEAIHRPVASTRTYLPSLSPRPLRRCHPRQEPDAVMPHVRICGGGLRAIVISTPTLGSQSTWVARSTPRRTRRKAPSSTSSTVTEQLSGAKLTT